MPFLLVASDFQQLGVFCLLHVVDRPLRCAVSLGKVRRIRHLQWVAFQKFFSF